MLGNWSLGDYFKQDQLRWVFEFLTKVVKIAPEKLFVTVFAGNDTLGIPRDTEAVEIWQKLFQEVGINAKAVNSADEKGMQAGRIFYYPEKKNWWSRSGTPDKMPAGEPGGPDSEIFYDFGEKLGLHEQSIWKDEPCHVNCDCGRFLEIGNSVFMQYQKQADGSFQELPQKNVDFGGGLERILAASQDKRDVFQTELFWPIIAEIEKLTKKKYAGENRSEMRVIADHLKAAVFLIKDGVMPSNKAQGYFLRRLIRRATVKLNQLGGGLDAANLFTIAEFGILPIYDGVYFDVKNDRDTIGKVLLDEASKFTKSLDKGLREFEKQATVNGKFAFDLYQTYGFPLEITLELALQNGQQFVVDDFLEEFEKHKNLSRTASAGMFKGGLADHSEITTKYHTTTHLLQAALRKILGTHVQQKGSNITAKRMRFDFSHPAPLTSDQIQQVQTLVNDWIKADLPVTVQTMQKQAALDSGAIAFFVEKYPDQVTVYTIGKNAETDWVSKELCGGPHVKSTGEIGEIELFKEQSASAGVRRIYAKVI
jgi:alanyl-tRNA synthetase